jgi:hypothetical protein
MEYARSVPAIKARDLKAISGPECEMTDGEKVGMDRRTFVKQAAGTLLATGMDARS